MGPTLPHLSQWHQHISLSDDIISVVALTSQWYTRHVTMVTACLLSPTQRLTTHVYLI